MEVYDPHDDDFPPAGGGHAAKQMRDSLNAIWYSCGAFLVFAALAAIIALCDWIAGLI